MWSFDDASGDKLSQHISNTTNFIPFCYSGTFFTISRFSGTCFEFYQNKSIPALMVVIGGPFVGVSYFIWNNGILMLLVASYLLGLGATLCTEKKEKN
jgi:hypothetical protein